jgi:outer membrane protein
MVIYLFLVASLRLAGKRELAQLNPFDCVVLMAFSNTVHNGIIGNGNSVSDVMIGAALLGVNYVVGRLLFGHEALNRLIEGDPDILLAGGKILPERLRAELMTLPELVSVAHKQGYASLDNLPVTNSSDVHMSGETHIAARHGGGSSRANVPAWAILLALMTVLGVAPAAAQTLPKKNLAQCIEIALRQHPDLKAAAATVDVGHARTWGVIANVLPQVSADYSASQRHSSVSTRTSGPLGPQGQAGTQPQTFDYYSTGVSLSQILFDFGQSLNTIRATRATEHSIEADASTTRETVVFDVKQSYFNLLTAKRLLGVADENTVQSQKHVDLAQGRLDIGLAARFDVTQAQLQLTNAELVQVTAQSNVAVAIETLRNALGLDGPLEFDIVDTLDIHDVRLDEDKALALAYDHRPELLSQRFQEVSLSEQIAAIRKNYLPNVTGGASYIWSGDSYPLQSSWNIGAAVNFSLFNGGLTTAQVGEARATLANLRYREHRLRQQIALQVRQAVLNLAVAHKSIRVSEKGLQQARENGELAEGRYKTGLGNIIELTDAQTALTVAEGANVQALSNYKTAIAALEQATAQALGEETSEPVPTPGLVPEDTH